MEPLTMPSKTIKPKASKKQNSFEQKKHIPFFAPHIIQPKLTVNQPNDIYEQEADYVADNVMRMGDKNNSSAFFSPAHHFTKIQRKCAACEEEKIQRKEDEEEDMVQTKRNHDLIQRKCAACEHEDEVVQRKEKNGFIQRVTADCEETPELDLPPATLKVNGTPLQRKSNHKLYDVPEAVSNSIESSKGQGNQIEPSLLSFMNPRFNKDFSAVRIHTNNNAANLSRQLGARAFTVGNNIYFNSGEYQPDNQNGKKLIAHELAHVVQQTNVSPAKNHVLLKRQEGEIGEPKKPVPQNVCDKYEQVTDPILTNNTTGDAAASQANVDYPATVAADPPATIPKPETAEVVRDIPIAPVNVPPGKANQENMPDDPAFKELIADSKKHAKKQKKHVEPASKKTAEAVDAVHVKEDNTAVNSGATIITVSKEIEKTGDKEFKAEVFKADLKKKITEAIPDNEKDAKAFIKDPVKIRDVANETSGEIKSAQKTFVSDAEKIQDTSNADPQDIDAIPKAPDGTLVEETPGRKPVINDPSRAVPKPLPVEELQMDKEHDAASLDKAMADHNVDDNQLAVSEEPSFLDTLSEKQNSQKELCKIPQQLQQAQNAELTQRSADAKGMIKDDLAEMHGSRKGNFGQVHSKQQEVQSEGELRLQEYYADIKSIYTTTQKNVTNSLSYLDCMVSSIFQDAVDAAFKVFEKNVHDRLDYYYDWHVFSRDYEKEDKWTRLGNAPIDEKIKSLTKKRDSLPETDPQWKVLNQEIETYQGKRTKLIIEKTFDEEKEIFINSLDLAITDISNRVADGLNHAKKLIHKGRDAVDKEYNALDGENQKKALDATNDIKSSFEDLESKVRDKEGDLKEGLIKQYTESVAKLKDKFETIRKEAALSWWERAWRKIKEIVMVIVDIGKLLFKIVVKAAGVVGDIISHPIRFFGNLIDAVSSGFKNFTKNIGKHLEDIMFKLILGVVPANIILPGKWDEKGIFSFVLQFFGLSKENIREQAVIKFGEPVVNQLERGFDLFILFKNEGFAGLWSHVKDKIGDIKTAIVEEVKTFFKESIIKAAIEFLLSALTPASGFIKVCKAIIGIVTFFIKNLVNILKLLDSILDSFVDMVAGRIAGAAKRIESALADILLIGIKFLAALVGINLDKIQSKISKIINALKNPVNRALQWLFDKAQMFAEKTGLLGAIKKGQEKYAAGKEWVKEKVEKGKEWTSDKIEAGKEKVKQVAENFMQWWRIKRSVTFSDGKTHTLYFEGEGEDAVLMMKSTPRSYKDFIKTIIITTKNAKKKKEQEDAKKSAMTIAVQLDKLIKQNKRTKTVGETKDITPEFETKLAELASFTIIFTERDDKQLPVSSAPEYGSLKNGFATSMTIKKLTRLGPAGTTVNVTNPTMDILLQRRNKGGSYYIAGHLLNHNLHGSGHTWQNLTPLTRTANGDHLRTIESALKSAVANGRVFSYTMSAVYGRKLNTQLIQEIDKSDKLPIRNIKKRIVEAEENVPFGITGKVEELDYDGNVLTGAHALQMNHSVANVIDQSSSLAYTVKK